MPWRADPVTIAGMDKEDLGTTETVILICERCGKSDDKSNNPSLALYKGLRRRLKETGQRRQVRPVLTSCLDLCPKKAVAILKVGKHAPPQIFSLRTKTVDRSLDSAVDEVLADLT